MKEVSYNDPYEAPVYVQIDDDDAEGLKEVLCFLNENADRLRKDERNYCKKIPYRLEANIYEGMDYAADEDVAKEAVELFEKQIIDKWLRENLTEAQYRRFRLLMEPEKVPGTRTKKQTICIHRNYIGAVEIPEKYRKTA